MATAITPELQVAMDNARSEGLTTQEIVNIEDAIHSSPVLANILNHAARQGHLNAFSALSSNEHAGGHYDDGTIAIQQSRLMFPRGDSQALDYLTATLAHEGVHATLVGFRNKYQDQFSMRVNNMTVPDSPSPHDYTGIIGTALEAARADETVAQTWGWNALQSRVEHASKGPVNQQLLLERGMFTDLVQQSDNSFRMKPGITLEPDGSIRMNRQHMDDFEPIAQHYYDQPATEAKLGQGNSDYVNYYAASLLSTIAQAEKTAHYPEPVEIRIDMHALGLDAQQLQDNGLNLGGQGKAFSFTDTSHGRHGWTTLHQVADSASATTSPMTAAQAEAEAYTQQFVDAAAVGDHEAMRAAARAFTHSEYGQQLIEQERQAIADYQKALPERDQPLFVQATEHLQRLGPKRANYTNEADMERIAGGLAAACAQRGMRRIDAVDVDAQRDLVATQVDRINPIFNQQASVSPIMAGIRPLEDSLQQLSEETQRQAQQQMALEQERQLQAERSPGRSL